MKTAVDCHHLKMHIIFYSLYKPHTFYMVGTIYNVLIYNWARITYVYADKFDFNVAICLFTYLCGHRETHLSNQILNMRFRFSHTFSVLSLYAPPQPFHPALNFGTVNYCRSVLCTRARVHLRCAILWPMAFHLKCFIGSLKWEMTADFYYTIVNCYGRFAFRVKRL